MKTIAKYFRKIADRLDPPARRPMVHIAAGNENWKPSLSEMQELSQLFMAADLDPLGAIVTRQGMSAAMV